jgi:methionyl-tRNA formyltransferase
MHQMNILYIGSSGALSLLPFKLLNASRHSIVAVGINSPIIFHDRIIALANESLALAATQQEIPVIDMSQSTENILQQCKALSVDLILVSCYGKRLPEALTYFPAKGCFNMHPSLLPCYRGPEPIFWQMKEASQTGVSWHRVVHDFDAGDIVAQQKVFFEEGASYSEINQKLAEAGADLLPALLADLSAGRLAAKKQDSELASYYPYPEAHDFVIDTSWPAQQAYNFMCATQAFGRPYHCQIGQDHYLLAEAVDYDNNDSLQEAELKAKKLYIPCKVGVLIATYTVKL